MYLNDTYSRQFIISVFTYPRVLSTSYQQAHASTRRRHACAQHLRRSAALTPATTNTRDY